MSTTLLQGYKQMLSDSEERMLRHYSVRFKCGLKGGGSNLHQCGLKIDNMHTIGTDVPRLIREIILVRPSVPIRQRRVRRVARRRKTKQIRADIDEDDEDSSIQKTSNSIAIPNLSHQTCGDRSVSRLTNESKSAEKEPSMQIDAKRVSGYASQEDLTTQAKAAEIIESERDHESQMTKMSN